jgi:pyruvate dehydrogenase E1 component
MPEGSREGILQGMYVVRPTSKPEAKLRAQLFGSGTILTEALKAQQILEERYGVGADVWSVTSYSNLHRDGHAAERWNRLHPTAKPRVPYVTQVTRSAPGVFVAASDYLKVLPDAVARWLPRKLHALGTDGFGRSETRAALRDFFEVDARFIALTTLHALMEEKQIKPEVVARAIEALGIEAEKPNPATS